MATEKVMKNGKNLRRESFTCTPHGMLIFKLRPNSTWLKSLMLAPLPVQETHGIKVTDSPFLHRADCEVSMGAFKIRVPDDGVLNCAVFRLTREGRCIWIVFVIENEIMGPLSLFWH
jgi:hypothetical protein